MRKKYIELRKLVLVTASILSLHITVFAQDSPVWNTVTETDAMRASNRPIVPVAYRTVTTDIPAMKRFLQNAPFDPTGSNIKSSELVLSLPMPDGNQLRFSVVESPVLHPELAARYPGIKSYLGQGIDDPYSSVCFDITSKGFHAMMFTLEGTVFIDPYRKGDTEHYISYFKKDFIPPPGKFKEYFADDPILDKPAEIQREVPSGTQLRTYRLAVAVDSNYYKFHGSTNLGATEAINTTMTRVNFVYVREVAIRFEVIAGNDQLYFTPTYMPYPYTVTGACDLRPQNQAIIDAIVGNANYDVGHLFAMSAGGCAIGNSPCNGGFKAWGVTGTDSPEGDPFDIDYVAHELGHQFNGSHTWNGNQGDCTAAQYVATAAYEPGSGSTIMSYAGICNSDNLQPNSDPYFHTHSFDQIVAYSTTGTGSGCPVVTPTGNRAPTVNAGPNFTVPKSTPFTLTGSANDPDGDGLTYCWEEFDLGPQGPPNVSTTTGPIFRSFSPTSFPTRTFPKISDILNNTTTIGEILPSIARTMTFRLTARDNRAGGGGVNYASMTLTVSGTAGPFEITSHNSFVSLCPGPTTVTWSVNNTNTLAGNVNIKLSTDGGITFPVTLAANTPNDGSESVNIPCAFSNTARIKVEAVGNIFFDISNANIQVGDRVPPSFTVPDGKILYKDENCDYDVSVAITGDVTDEADNCDNTLNATYTDEVVPGDCEGETLIARKWVLVDDCNNSTTKYQYFRIRDTTRPTFTQPADITIYKDANCDHDASLTVTGDVTNEDDNCDNSLNATYSDAVANGTCVGNLNITRTWTLTDDCGNSTSKTQMIYVRDTTRPDISNVSPTPAVLWPPNHKMVDVVINYDAVDNCSQVTSVLTISSNEPENGTGDGDTGPDMEVIDDHNIKLRAERAGNGNGRIYTITITSTDDCGNVATTTTTVLVPHNNITAPLAIVREGKSQPGLQVKALPNPSNSHFAVTVTSDSDKDKVLVTVFDLFGRRIEDKWMNSGATIILGEKLRAGSYVLRVTQGAEIKTLKIVKLN